MDSTIIVEKIESMIYEVRGKQVMFASDVAKLYRVETRRVNEVIKRNIERFPEAFCFQLTLDESENLFSRSQIATLNKRGDLRGYNIKYLPYVLTEQGIMMLSGLLRSDVAVKVNIQIIDAFVKMRHYISSNLMENKYLTEQVFENTKNIKLLQESFDKFKDKKVINDIYFEGQIYDSYSKILDIFSKAKSEIIIIDAYSDKHTLDIIKSVGVDVTIITSYKSKLSSVDISKYNSQYDNLKVIYNDTFHDRYFILDKNVFYHCGTSLNCIGKKTFSINRIDDHFVCNCLIDKISNFL